ncbi:pyridoxamine 5'-phosphate oxidase family protein [Amycolatopsis sp. CA-230715]|uniref:pyridoxamine 5'-phosphate oxidase family protein n=1 Tax=Amycolatopsis sp. CA-230715 TaxID=2745196 RepID=UPI001C03595C|nr:pyridoxamine 5'-phosphate oxidase family protein [Amycolatopsis sp. CA-230715]QWF76922.1 hypothetical protein HUW46_00302 [Amycolatopsis sp. CA-230715]
MAVSWEKFETAAPDLAHAVRACFAAAETHVLATLRRDGSPRVSGTEVDFTGAELVLGSMHGAVKARDLRRDGRFAVHANPGAELGDGDVKVAGVAVEVTDPAEVARLQGNSDPCHVFLLRLTEAVHTSVAGESIVIDTWREGLPRVRFERKNTGEVVRTEI